MSDLALLRWFIKNIGTFILALALAIAVWVSAVTASDPDETRTLDSLVSLDILGQDPGLIITNDIPSGVEVTLQAPSSIWRAFNVLNNPLKASVDLSGLGVGKHTIPVHIELPVQPARVTTLYPSVVSVFLEPLGIRTLPVDLQLLGDLAIGYEAGEPILSPNQITITGSEALINQIDSVIANLDITGLRENISQNLTPIPVDTEGSEIPGLTIFPNSVNLRMAVSQQGGYRDLVVKLTLTGRVVDGYRLASIAVTPPVVTIYSTDTELINSLPGYLETKALSLNDIKADFETNILLNLPPGVTLVGQQTVLVQVAVTPIEGSITLSERPVEVIGLRSGLTVQISPETVDVILSGPLPTLNALSTTDVQVRIDVSGLGAGTYQLTPQVDIVIEGITVESFLPSSVSVVIK